MMPWRSCMHLSFRWRLEIGGRRPATPVALREKTRPPRLAAVERDEHRIVIPTDLMFAAWRQLFPAERMFIFGARQTKRGIRATSLADVTEPRPSVVHVRACPEKMATTLIDLERTGAHFGVWVHSHPGEGSRATFPSVIDLNQEKDLRRHYSDRLIGIIAVRDGWLRVWGEAIKSDRVRVHWSGRGIEAHSGEAHVYRLTV
jgi:proteasome lid subunit RPN8/RPN11